MGEKWRERLIEPIDGSSLAVFRILFGGILFWEVLRYLPRIYERYQPDAFHFTFPLFEFVRPWPGDGMYWLFLLMGVAALGLMFGFFHRLSALLCLVAFSYVFLVEKAYYLNHFYLVLLLCFLMFLIDASASLSRDAWHRNQCLWQQVPAWHLFLVRAQIMIVYFYGGLAKLNGDWLRGEPLRHWLGNKETTPWMASLLGHDHAAYFFSYGGLFFDLTIGILLLIRSTRVIGIAGVLAFNRINGWLFQIGIFPWVMIAALVLFLEPDAPRRFIERMFQVSTVNSGAKRSRERRARFSAWCPFRLKIAVLYLLVDDFLLESAVHFNSWRQ